MLPRRPNRPKTLNFLLVGDDEPSKKEFMRSLPRRNDPIFDYSIATYKNTNIQFLDEKVNINMWEAGARTFPYVYKFFARSVDGIVLIYDILNSLTYKYLSSWVHDIREIAPAVPIIMVANNKHLEINRRVKEKHARAFAQKHCMQYLEISCFCNYRIEEALFLLSRKAFIKNAVQRFWTSNGRVSTLEHLCLRKLIISLNPDTKIEELPLTKSMKETLRRHIPKNVTQTKKRFSRIKRFKKIFRKKEKTSPDTSLQLPHDRVKPSRVYKNFVSHKWFIFPSCLPL